MSIFIVGSVAAGLGTVGTGAVLGYRGELKIRDIYGRVIQTQEGPQGEVIRRLVTNLGEVPSARNSTKLMNSITTVANALGKMPEGFLGA